MRLILITAYMYLFLSACVTPLDIYTSFQGQLVVEGIITDQPGPYLVKMSKSIPVNDLYNNQLVMVSGASISIYDDQENSEALIEQSPGYYYTKTFQGIIGRSYWIKIVTNEGNAYQSAPEKLLPVGDFTNLSFEFKQNEPADANNQITSKNGFNFFIDSEILPEQEDRVWWKWTGTFEIFTYPGQRKKIYVPPVGGAPMEPQKLIPNPPPCSGYAINKPNTLSATLVGPLADCQCCTCWVTQYNQVPLISDPKFTANGKINKLNLGFIEANRRTFYNKYYLSVDQMSVSQTIYNFWKNVIVEKGNSSNLFQTPPPKIIGNISSTTPNSVPAIGYFAASAVKTHSIVIYREDVPYQLRLIDTLAYSCTEAYKYSSTKKPTFW